MGLQLQRLLIEVIPKDHLSSFHNIQITPDSTNYGAESGVFR